MPPSQTQTRPPRFASLFSDPTGNPAPGRDASINQLLCANSTTSSDPTTIKNRLSSVTLQGTGVTSILLMGEGKIIQAFEPHVHEPLFGGNNGRYDGHFLAIEGELMGTEQSTFAVVELPTDLFRKTASVLTLKPAAMAALFADDQSIVTAGPFNSAQAADEDKEKVKTRFGCYVPYDVGNLLNPPSGLTVGYFWRIIYPLIVSEGKEQDHDHFIKYFQVAATIESVGGTSVVDKSLPEAIRRDEDVHATFERLLTRLFPRPETSDDSHGLAVASEGASCGIAEIDDIKLKDCDDCDLVRYCSDACRDDHKSEHKEACKIRAAELRDELLFKQPESIYPGDCPICILPMPIHPSKLTLWVFMPCCSKIICNGCYAAYQKASLVPSCPFCRKLISEIEMNEECEKLNMKRIKANDPAAMSYKAAKEFRKGNYDAALEWFSKAAELGDAEAHYRLAKLYQKGKGVGKNGGKELYHLEEAAIRGHPDARFNLGCYEGNRNIERALKHLLIAAAQGVDRSIKVLMQLFQEGFEEFVTKEDLTTALRAHQAAVDATKSPQRKAAEQIFENAIRQNTLPS